MGFFCEPTGSSTRAHKDGKSSTRANCLPKQWKLCQITPLYRVRVIPGTEVALEFEVQSDSQPNDDDDLVDAAEEPSFSAD